jgi:large subunit ribosomal protein L15e
MTKQSKTKIKETKIEKTKGNIKNKTNNVKENIAPAQGFYSYLGKLWRAQSPEFVKDIRKRMIDWRAGKRVQKVEKPLRLDRARKLGYKAKRGFIVYRVTLERGGRKRPRPNTKRRSKRLVARKILKMNYQWVAEQRVQHRHLNLEILNSYLIGKDSRFYFFEVIAVDPDMPEIKSDKTINWICRPENRKRVFRGLTSAGRKSRGLRHTSNNLKIRPSIRSWKRKGK